MNLTCNVGYAFAMTNHTYFNASLTKINAGAGASYSNFTFTNSSKDIITTKCTDQKSPANAQYILSQATMINDFKAGKFGTFGQFGGLDLITLLAITLSMIGFNRVNSGAGVVICFFVIGALAYFGIITFPAVFIGAIAIIITMGVITTRIRA